MFEEVYRLADTGQGYNRLHSCPNVGGLMHRILRSVQRRVGEAWVGLSVVHLGDRVRAAISQNTLTTMRTVLLTILDCCVFAGRPKCIGLH